MSQSKTTDTQLTPAQVEKRDDDRAYAADMGFSFCEECGLVSHYQDGVPHVHQTVN